MTSDKTGPRPVPRVAAALCAVALLAAASLTACAVGETNKTSVVVTTNILGDITRAIVGDQAEVTVLMKPNTDPHSFAISAQQAAGIERAGLVVYNGLGLEEGVLRHVRAAETAGVAVLAAAELANPIRFTADDSAGLPDPHFWTDPRRVSDVVGPIAERVIDHVSTVDAAVIRRNADRYRAALSGLETTMDERFAGIPPQRRKLVTNHHVFGYLAQRFGFEVIGAVLPSGTTLASPSASDLKSLADTVRGAGAPAIFADSSQPDRLARVLADHAGLEVAVVPLFSESLSETGGGAATYLEMMRANTDSITRALTSS